MDPNKCFGKPCIDGLRMPIASTLGYLSGGISIEEMLEQWPELEREDICQVQMHAYTVVLMAVPLYPAR